ncbi:ABC transporter substrate-binding protein [Clostridium swellfunianum]|uniref:ABC transporter substrate-binding protein n=1 Tax=Clostridium swellfunianum TaxID=1367462 RepID=UPI002030BC43|nr:ABC transporter substrate-binding protein [Clostridium swellfunianum]MCM0646884.1 ABC transporter substrate-binding protein [Clostridium swellfunianum]
MVGKKSSILMALLVSSSILGGCAKTQASISNSSQNEKKTVKIGISQIVEHPALDSTRKGFIEALKSKGFEEGKNLQIDFQNAQGEPATAQTIAKNFVSKKEDMILAIATPSAQAAFNATKNIPILITAVTDPVQAGLVKSLDKPETNVTGTSDNIPIEKQFELLKQLVPKSKKIGIIYNTSETNSEIQVEAAKKAAPSFNLEVLTAGVTNVNELPQALGSLLDKIDVLYVPTDNLVVSSIPLITNQCYKKNIPVIGSERGQVEGGALATTGIDYYKLGYQTGLAAVEVLNGKSPKDIPVTTLKDMQLVINIDTAKKLNITVPEELNSKAEKVTGGTQ